MSWFLHCLLCIALWGRCWAKGRACQKHGWSATLPFPSTASCRLGSRNRQVTAEDPLCKSPLDPDLSYGNSEFLKNQAKMAQIECLQLETGFESLVRQAVSHRRETNLRSSAFHSPRVETVACTHFRTWPNATSPLHLVTREACAAKTAHQNVVVFLHLLLPLLFTLWGLVTVAMLIHRYWWLVMIITTLGLFSAVL